jgi:hypothetical protein
MLKMEIKNNLKSKNIIWQKVGVNTLVTFYQETLKWWKKFLLKNKNVEYHI